MMLKYVLIVHCTVLAFTVCTENLYKNNLRYSEYDYIIVGAGTAGSVLANRLSEDSSKKVLVLESGGLPLGISEVPLFSGQLVWGPMDWKFVTEPQENASLQMSERRTPQPRGKVLGGTSTINGMQYVRGERRDFDEWARGGATGWDWNQALHYFKKAEDQKDPQLAQTGVHGVGGHQTVTVIEYESPLRQAYFEAFEYLGHQETDINSGSPLGFSTVQGSVRDGRRCSTEKAYLRPAAVRDNLDILYDAHVTKVLFSEEKRAHAVRFEHHNATRDVKAKSEIILSAGAFGTPQILMLSGVGPSQHLRDLEIPVVADLPVGENLQDHITVGGMVFTINSSVSLVQSRVVHSESVGEFLDGKGPLTVPAAVECLGVLNSRHQDPSENWPDLRFFVSSNVLYPVTDDKSRELVSKAAGKDAFSIHPMVARPKSRGFVKLRSTNPHEPPIIDPQYLAEEEDLEALVEGIKMGLQLASTPPLQKFDPVRIPSPVPGCEGLEEDGEEYLRCWARALTLSSLHPCCTCPMGDSRQPNTVVDPELRVKGVSGLSIADASVMPQITSGNTMAPCIMIGEKAADLIKARWDHE